jgi:putative Holliday junction resolvase
MARSIGLDIGNRRIGVAITDEGKFIARPLCIIDRKTQHAINEILKYLAQFTPDEIVVGYPYHLDGKQSEQAQNVDAFIAELKLHTHLPIHPQDERFSTSEAQVMLNLLGKPKPVLRKPPRPSNARRAPAKKIDHTRQDDAHAAAIILQRYLDEHYNDEDT